MADIIMYGHTIQQVTWDPVMQIETIETPELGDHSYLVHDGERAVVIDPQRDIDRVLRAADAAGVTIDLVVETHIHNDYVSGGLALARAVGARYGVAAAEPVAFDRSPLSAGDALAVGRLLVRVEPAPGHTLHHLAFVVEEDGMPRAVFTGGSLLYGTVGRTDLDHRSSPAALTRAQFRGVRALLAGLPGAVSVHPTHGFGSFCSSAASSGATASTIGIEQRDNLVSRCTDEDVFVETILGGLTAYPRYYAQMGIANRRGAPAADGGAVQPISADELRQRLDAGEWIIDLQGRRLYAERHLEGTVNIELGTHFTTYLGWVIPAGNPITLVGSHEEISSARLALARIGLDHPGGALRATATEMIGNSASRYSRVDFSSAHSAIDTQTDTVLDVRRDDEWRAGHIRDAVHVPLPDLLERLGEVPPRRLWVHCASGFRASIAASLLDRSGFEVVLIDDDFDEAGRAGFIIDTPAAAEKRLVPSASVTTDQEDGDGEQSAEPAHVAHHR